MADRSPFKDALCALEVELNDMQLAGDGGLTAEQVAARQVARFATNLAARSELNGLPIMASAQLAEAQAALRRAKTATRPGGWPRCE